MSELAAIVVSVGAFGVVVAVTCLAHWWENRTRRRLRAELGLDATEDRT